MAKLKSAPSKPAAKEPFRYASAGRYSMIEENGSVNHNMTALSRVSAARKANQLGRGDPLGKTAGMFGDGALGAINEADSNNIGYYSYQFPVDQMEMPASRAEELEFFRLAYTRDPIVARAIDLHTELPLSKMKLEKSKCSVDAFSDFVFDYFQRLVNDTRMFHDFIQGTREYHVIGESFMFVEQPEGYTELELSPATAEALKKGRGFQAGTSPLTEANNADEGGNSQNILPDFIEARRAKESSLGKAAALRALPVFMKTARARREAEIEKKAEFLELRFAEAGVSWKGDSKATHRKLVKTKLKLAKMVARREPSLRQVESLLAETMNKQAGVREEDLARLREVIGKVAAPGDAPAPGTAPVDVPTSDTLSGDPGGTGDLGGEGGTGDLGGMGDDPMGAPPMGGGGSFGAPPSMSPDQAGAAQGAVAVADEARRLREINELERYIHLLERKKQLLEELKDMVEERKLEEEIFSHVVNPDFEGFERIQILQPERIAIDNEGGETRITYKPSGSEKSLYENDPDVPKDVKDSLEEEGVIALNQDPFKGSYVIHFARKKSGYELHGRSALQSCMRSIIYREKLRQVQTTLASRNMTPKTLITAPGVSERDVAELRAHADEAKNDPDYTIVCNYEVTWNEIDASSRLLQLEGEWQHTNSNLAIGLGFSPEILIGEGMYSGNRIALELMSVTYTQFREELSDIIENQIFKPIAMLKGFYEMDKYGRPRWIYPKVSFGHLALRDSNDLYECMYNLYAKGSLPVEPIYELLGLDAETITRQLEDAMFTVKDPKFSELMGSIYASIGGEFAQKTNLLKRLTENMHLHEEGADQSNLEGSGEGM